MRSVVKGIVSQCWCNQSRVVCKRVETLELGNQLAPSGQFRLLSVVAHCPPTKIKALVFCYTAADIETQDTRSH